MAYNFSPKIVTDGLVLYLDAANTRSYVSGSTTWNDLSRGGNNGTLINGPTFNSGNGGSIVFDGSNDYVGINNTITVSTVTFVSWIRRNGTQGAYTGILFSRGIYTSGMSFFSNGTNLGYTWNDSFNTYTWASNLTIPNLEWCMCVLVISPTAATAYLCQQSGITNASNNIPHSGSILNGLSVGRDSISGRYFNGRIAQSILYNRALTAAEVLQNYNTTKSRFGL